MYDYKRHLQPPAPEDSAYHRLPTVQSQWALGQMYIQPVTIGTGESRRTPQFKLGAPSCAVLTLEQPSEKKPTASSQVSKKPSWT